MFLNNATTTIAAGANLTFGSASVFTQGAGTLAINAAGSFVMSGNTFHFNGGMVTGTPIHSDSALTIGAESTGAATFSTRRSSTLSGNIAVGQSVLVQSTGNATATLTAAAAFTNAGTLTLQTFDNGGASNLVVSSGTLTNAATGVINVKVGNGGGRVISADLTNNGTVNFNSDANLSKPSGVFLNNATTNIAAEADLTFGAASVFTQGAGTLAINATGSFVMDSDTFNFNGGTVTGTPILSDSALTIGAESTGAATFSTRQIGRAHV